MRFAYCTVRAGWFLGRNSFLLRIALQLITEVIPDCLRIGVRVIGSALQISKPSPKIRTRCASKNVGAVRGCRHKKKGCLP
jgi:hypothetical protein